MMIMIVLMMIQPVKERSYDYDDPASENKNKL